MDAPPWRGYWLWSFQSDPSRRGWLWSCPAPCACPASWQFANPPLHVYLESLGAFQRLCSPSRQRPLLLFHAAGHALASHRGHWPALSCLHAKVPLAALLGLMHLRVALAFVVLGRTGRCNQGGVHHRAGLEHQSAINQFGIDSRQYLRAQVVLLEPVSKAQDCAFIRQSGDARIELGKLAVQRDVMQGLFHGRVGVSKELQQQMNAQHHLSGKRRALRLASRRMRRNQGQQLRPRNHQVLSSRNSRLRVRLVTSSNPVVARLICFI